LPDDAAALLPQQGEVAGSMGDVRAAWKGDGYPDLRTIPEVPDNLPGAAQWAGMEQGLAAAGGSLNNDPRATLATQIVPAESWAGPLRSGMESDPRFAPPPDWMLDSRWRDAALARMNALAARQR
jgi:hypothetical protein